MRRAVFAFVFLLAAIGSAFAGAEIPFRLANGFILVDAQVPGRPEPLVFLVDSGASATVFHLPSAKRLDLPLGAPETVHGVGSQAPAVRLPSVPVVLGSVQADDAILALDLSKAEPLCGEPIDGLIGAGFFTDRIVQIDYAASKMRVLSEMPAARESATRLPLRRINGVFCAPMSVNGSQPRWARIDTGCNDAVHWVVPRRTEKRRRGTTIGFTNEDRDSTLATVRLGDRTLRQVETSLHGRPLFQGEAGLLGSGLLSQYLVTLDGIRGVLWLAE